MRGRPLKNHAAPGVLLSWASPWCKRGLRLMVATHVALLRGVNLGGSNRLSMKELAALFVEAGCREVVTYVQSGNVVFQASDMVAERIAAQITEAIAVRFGLHVPIVTRTVTEIAQVVQGNPFLREGAD